MERRRTLRGLRELHTKGGTLRRQKTVEEEKLKFLNKERDFVFSCIAFTCGFGNVLHFPLLCYYYQGMFFLPYFLSVLFVGLPVIIFELSIGQLSGSSMSSWMFCPFFAGTEQITVCVSIIISSYQIIKMALAFFYFCMSFKFPLPWKKCRKEWSTFYCRDNLVDIPLENCSGTIRPYDNGTCYDTEKKTFQGIYNRSLARAHDIWEVLPAEDYFKYEALGYGRSAGLHDIGPIHWRIALCLAVLWLFVLFNQQQGFRFYRKIVYYTTIIPFIFLLVLMTRALSLKGSGIGIQHYLYPNPKELKKLDIWSSAVTQVMYSFGLATNGLVFFTRYNRFNYNIVRDALIIVLVDILLSFFAGILVFGYLGGFSLRFKVKIKDILSFGSSFLFVILPQELADEIMPNTSCMLFFFILFLLTFNSQVMFVDIVVCSLAEYFHLSHKNKTHLSCSLCFILFLIGLSMTTEGGIYIYTIFNTYATLGNVTVAILLMTISIFIYGTKKFCNDIERMVGPRPLCGIPWKYMKWYFIASWTITIPLCMLAFLAALFLSHPRPSVGAYVLPKWANAIGWLMSTLSVLSFFFDFIRRLLKEQGGVKERFQALLQPHPSWGLDPDDDDEENFNRDSKCLEDFVMAIGGGAEADDIIGGGMPTSESSSLSKLAPAIFRILTKDDKLERQSLFSGTTMTTLPAVYGPSVSTEDINQPAFGKTTLAERMKDESPMQTKSNTESILSEATTMTLPESQSSSLPGAYTKQGVASKKQILTQPKIGKSQKSGKPTYQSMTSRMLTPKAPVSKIAAPQRGASKFDMASRRLALSESLKVEPKKPRLEKSRSTALSKKSITRKLSSQGPKRSSTLPKRKPSNKSEEPGDSPV